MNAADEGLHILINEDSPSDAALLVRALNAEFPCARLDMSSDRASFITALERGPFDILITDFSLPGFNAIDAVRLLHDADAHVPIIVSSGTIGEERAVELIREGVTDYCMKDNLQRIGPIVRRAVKEARESRMLDEARRDLVAAADEWRDTVNAISDVILMIDSEGRIRRTNRAGEEFLATHEDAMHAQDCHELLSALRPDADLPTVGFGDETIDFEWGPCKPDGSWYAVRCEPIVRNAGIPSGRVLVISNITERKRAQDQQSALLERLRRTLQGSVGIAIKMVESRDPYTAGHQENVARLSVAIAEHLGWPEVDLEVMRMAGQLHDIGKVAVPAEILVRPGRLTDTEWAIIREHPSAAEKILRDAQFSPAALAAVGQHHERLDGSGYPRALAGDAICLEARILAVADVTEAMLAHRPYRPARTNDETTAVLNSGRDTQFDGRVVDACLHLLEARGLDSILAG